MTNKPIIDKPDELVTGYAESIGKREGCKCPSCSKVNNHHWGCICEECRLVEFKRRYGV